MRTLLTSKIRPKRPTSRLLLAALLTAGALALFRTDARAAEMRTWTFEQSGKTMQGEAVGFAEDTVTLKLPEGKTVSIRIAYLTEKDRTYLTAEPATQWKEVEIVKLEGAASTGRYKKCTVRGKVSDPILLQLLPAPVEAILNNQNEQSDQIDYLKSWIADRAKDKRHTKALAQDLNHFARGHHHLIAREWTSLGDAKADLPKLQRAYDDYVKKTRAERTVKIRNTGFVYQGSPVWECADPGKPQQ
jgi:hypothetical protein